MRAIAAILLIGVPPLRAQPRAWVSSELGLAPVRASGPYTGSLAGIARVGLATHAGANGYLELAATALGALTPADAHVLGRRELPNTLAGTAGIGWLVGADHQWQLQAGVGGYRIARRADAPGGTGLGYDLGVTRRGPGVLTLSARLVYVPEIGGARLWLLPITVGLRRELQSGEEVLRPRS